VERERSKASVPDRVVTRRRNLSEVHENKRRSGFRV